MKIITTVNGQEVAVDSLEITKGMPNILCYKRFEKFHNANLGTGKLLEAEVMGYEIKMGICDGVEIMASVGYSPSYFHNIYVEDKREYTELKKIEEWVEKNLGGNWSFYVRWVDKGDTKRQTDADCKKIRSKAIPIAASLARKFLATANNEEIKTQLFELHFERYDCIGFEVEHSIKNNYFNIYYKAMAVQNEGEQVITAGGYIEIGDSIDLIDNKGMERGHTAYQCRHWAEYPGTILWVARKVPYGEWTKGYDYLFSKRPRFVSGAGSNINSYLDEENNNYCNVIGLISFGQGSSVNFKQAIKFKRQLTI